MHVSTHIAAATALLRRHGAAGLAHPGGTLLAHLARVERYRAPGGQEPAGLVVAQSAGGGAGPLRELADSHVPDRDP